MIVKKLLLRYFQTTCQDSLVSHEINLVRHEINLVDCDQLFFSPFLFQQTLLRVYYVPANKLSGGSRSPCPQEVADNQEKL